MWSPGFGWLRSVANETVAGLVFGWLCAAGEMKRGVCACMGEPGGKELRLMRNQMDLDHQLESANRVPSGFADDDESRALLDEIGARIVASDRARAAATGRYRFSQPFARRGLILGSAVGVLAVGAAVAATVLSTSTAGAPGFCQTVSSETADIPFPDGSQAWQNWALLSSTVPRVGTTMHELCDTTAGEHVADDGVLSPNGTPATVVIPPISEKVQFVEAAFCAWTDQWLHSQADGDTAAASQAASEIAGATQWQATQEINARNSGVSSRQLAWLTPVQQAVQADDVSAVTRTFVYYPKGTIPDSECLTAKPPADSDSGTVYDPPRWTPGQGA
jgi:hypothetical protein